MNKEQKEVQQIFLKQEKQVINDLKRMYKESLDQVNEKIQNLLGRSDADELNVIYQIEYQKNLKTQIEGIMLQLQSNQFETISDYLKNSYNDGFIGTMYDMQNQGVPLIFPIDQKAVVNAIVNKSKLTDPLYERLGYDIKKLQKDIASEISRGLSTGLSYNDIARNIEYRANVTRNKAALIARTEAHRIQCQATSDAQFKAKEKGADVVKQWDAFLDGRTRKTHRELDGQIKELEEPFEYGRYEAMFPGEFGNPALDCNCRCALLQRARWALGNDFTKAIYTEDGTVLETIQADKYDDFKKDYYNKIDKPKNISIDENEKLKAEVEAALNTQKDRSNPGSRRKANKELTLDDINKKYSESLGFEVDVSRGDIENIKQNLDYYKALTEEYNQESKVTRIDTEKPFNSKAGAETLFSPDGKYATISFDSKVRKNVENILINYNVIVDEKNANISGLVHEFAHTISSSKYITKENEEFWKEIKSIKNKYSRALTNIDKQNIVDKTLTTTEAKLAKEKIFISQYANKNVDEFFAEAFTLAKLSSNPSPYAIEVLKTVDKYYSK